MSEIINGEEETINDPELYKKPADKTSKLLMQGKVRNITAKILETDSIHEMVAKVLNDFQLGQQVTFKKMVHCTCVQNKNKTMMINIGEFVISEMAYQLSREMNKTSRSSVKGREPKGIYRIGITGTKLFKFIINPNGMITLWRSR